MLSVTHLYTFNDGDAADSVGAAHGSLHNGASVVDGALYLQNIGVTSGQTDKVQYVQFPAGLLPDSGSATIEVWYASVNASNWSRVFDFGSQTGANGESYLFLTPHSGSSDTRAVFRRNSTLAELNAAGSATDDGPWHMATVVVDNAAKALTLYIDGVLKTTTALGRNGDIGLIDDSLNFLGRSLYNSDPGFTGLIDELRIYNETLTPTQIAAHAGAGAAAYVLAGDYNSDGAVDAADHSVWAANFGSTSDLAADGNGDGVVDAADYTVWRDHLGAGETPPDRTLDNQSLILSSLSGTVIELTGQSELHLTGAANPLSSSEVRLDSIDSSLFFENVPPTEVISKYLSQVRVNGVAAVPGFTVRVVQYELGTVVLPYAYDYQPLVAFTGPHFTGDSVAFDQYTYYNSQGALGVVAGDLSSFRLKKGYMATLATQANGGGDSQVFVAQDFDLEVSLLPEGFDDQVRFLRIVPWRWVSKKGASDIGPDTLDAAWFYNWNNSASSTYDYEYVPIKQQLYWPADPTDKRDTTHWLGFNEPNNPVEDSYTSLGNGSVDAAIAYWPNMLKTGLRVGSPAVTDGGKAWLYEFMDKAIAANLRVDYIAIHNYQANNSAASLQAWLKDIYDRYHLPIWITEFNNGANWTSGADPTQQQNAAAIGSFIDMMDTTPWIERYSIYSRVEAVRELTYADGSLTPTGVVYHDNASPIGYVQAIPAPAPISGGVVQLDFEGDAYDASGNGYNGHVAGVPAYVAGVQGQALDLNGVNGHVQLPEGVADGDAFSFAAWVRWDGGGNWQRLFDFGDDTDSYLFLTPSNGSTMRFAIKNHGAEQVVSTTPLAVGQWTHVAVTLGRSSAKLYVNGALVAQNNAVTLKPSDFKPSKNYLGKSQFLADPHFNGQIDGVHITNYVLTAAQISGLMSNQSPVFIATETPLAPAVAGAAYVGSVAGLASDPDGTSVSYTKAYGPAWLTVSYTGELSGTPTAADVGEEQIVLTVTDVNGATAFKVLTLPIVASPAASGAYASLAMPAVFSYAADDAAPWSAGGAVESTAEAAPADSGVSKALLLLASSSSQEAPAEIAAAPLGALSSDPTSDDQETLEAWLDAAFAVL